MYMYKWGAFHVVFTLKQSFLHVFVSYFGYKRKCSRLHEILDTPVAGNAT